MRKISAFGLSALLVAMAATATASVIKVDNAKDLRTALAAAGPGDVIEIKAGEYVMGGGTQTGQNGTSERVITLRCAGDKGYARLNLSGQVAFRVKNRFWEFRGIHFAGDVNNTEATVFMDGPQGCGDIYFVDCKISGSKTHGMKAAKLREKPVDNIIIEHTELFDTGATGFDLPAGDNWILRRNYIHDYGKGGGVTYGIFLKGGGKHGIIEGNFVDGAAKGTTLGISFGGGLMGKQWLPLLPDGTLGPEHDGGIARNNIVINTTDSAFHCNNGANCKFYNNLTWHAATFQMQASYPKNPVLINNLITGSVKGASENKATLTPKKEWFVDPENSDFRLTTAGKTALTGKGEPLSREECPTDFFGNKRDPKHAVIGPVLPTATESTKWVARR